MSRPRFRKAKRCADGTRTCSYCNKTSPQENEAAMSLIEQTEELMSRINRTPKTKFPSRWSVRMVTPSDSEEIERLWVVSPLGYEYEYNPVLDIWQDEEGKTVRWNNDTECFVS